MTRVLFVCLGNICRSPMAEAIFRQLVDQAGLSSQIMVDSAATSREEEGNPPHPGARDVLAAHGLSTVGMRSRPITNEDFMTADWIITMDHQNLATLQRRAPAGTADKIYLCLSVLPGQETAEIPDPWYTHKFETTYQTLMSALPTWLHRIAPSATEAKADRNG